MLEKINGKVVTAHPKYCILKPYGNKKERIFCPAESLLFTDPKRNDKVRFAVAPNPRRPYQKMAVKVRRWDGKSNAVVNPPRLTPQDEQFVYDVFQMLKSAAKSFQKQRSNAPQ